MTKIVDKQRSCFVSSSRVALLWREPRRHRIPPNGNIHVHRVSHSGISYVPAARGKTGGTGGATTIGCRCLVMPGGVHCLIRLSHTVNTQPAVNSPAWPPNERSGSAAGRAADRPLEPVVSLPFALPHLAPEDPVSRQGAAPPPTASARTPHARSRPASIRPDSGA